MLLTRLECFRSSEDGIPRLAVDQPKHVFFFLQSESQLTLHPVLRDWLVLLAAETETDQWVVEELVLGVEDEALLDAESLVLLELRTEVILPGLAGSHLKDNDRRLALHPGEETAALIDVAVFNTWNDH